MVYVGVRPGRLLVHEAETPAIELEGHTFVTGSHIEDAGAAERRTRNGYPNAPMCLVLGVAAGASTETVWSPLDGRRRPSGGSPPNRSAFSEDSIRSSS